MHFVSDSMASERGSGGATAASSSVATVLSSATVQIAEAEVAVTVDKRAHNPYLVASGLADHPTPMPWFGDKLLKIRFA